MMDFVEFIIEKAYIMVPALWIIGFIIKHTEWIKDKYIPLILLVISLGFSPMLLGGYTPENLAQAVLVAGGAVLSNELYRQSKKEE